MRVPLKIGTEIFLDNAPRSILYEITKHNLVVSNGVKEIQYDIKDKLTGVVRYGISEFDVTPAITTLNIDDLLMMHQFYTSMIKVFGDIDYQEKLIIIEEQLKFKSKIHKKA